MEVQAMAYTQETVVPRHTSLPLHVTEGIMDQTSTKTDKTTDKTADKAADKTADKTADRYVLWFCDLECITASTCFWILICIMYTFKCVSSKSTNCLIPFLTSIIPISS